MLKSMKICRKIDLDNNNRYIKLMKEGFYGPKIGYTFLKQQISYIKL